MLRSRLIDEVKKRRWMYDKKMKEYANRKEWFKMVAELLNIELAPYEIQCSGSELMTMWDELYSNFKKMYQTVSSAPSGSSAAVLKIANDLYQALLFVEDTVNPRPPLSSLENVNGASFNGQLQGLQGPHHSFTNAVQSNFNMWQMKSGKKRRAPQKSSMERGKFKKQTGINNDLIEAKEVIDTVKKFIEKTTDDVNEVVQENISMPVDENKKSIQNMLTKKFLQLSLPNIEPAFKEMRSGILALFGELADGKV